VLDAKEAIALCVVARLRCAGKVDVDPTGRRGVVGEIAVDMPAAN